MHSSVDGRVQPVFATWEEEVLGKILTLFEWEDAEGAKKLRDRLETHEAMK